MFAAINYISCKEEYKERFEELFRTRARAIDTMPGFKFMNVLQPVDGISDYLIVSFWEKEENFKSWTGSKAFIDGHKRGFEDIAEAKASGKEPPMKSVFKTYRVISN
jgi:heme-degrading monooxygenase HmoA